jgi:glycosyltransferase involved in cell wall biosynthesis
LIVREANTIASTTGALPRWVPGELLYKRLYPRADVIVSPTETIARELAALSRALAGKLAVIHNPVDVAGLRIRADGPCREPGEGLRLVSAGRLTYQKGYDRLLDILPRLPSTARLTVFGKGEDQAKLEAQARTLGVSDRVRFAGFSLDVPRWIAGADALLLPSRWEGLPNVVLESLALGTPAIVSDQAAVDGLARSAGSGAIRVAPVDATFADLICRVQPANGGMASLRPSLLPSDYELRTVISRWTSLLEQASGSLGELRV